MTKARVAIVMGSESDLEVAQKAAEVLERFEVPFDVRVMSAHRSPEKVRDFAAGAKEKGFAVIIAIAGGAAHLAGVLASATALPVIGVPVATGVSGGLDSLLSTVQMPSGVPVLAVSTGSGGAPNAALAAIRILAVSDGRLARRLDAYRASLATGVNEQDRKVRARFGKGRR